MRYGSAAYQNVGIDLSTVPRSPSGTRTFTTTPSAVAIPKSSAPPNAPIGVQRPKIIAASAMKPRPPVIPFWNEPVDSSVRNAPARPASAQPKITFW